MAAKTITATLLAALAALAAATSALAGSYHLYACRTPAGEPAPADGWSGSLAPGGAYDDYASDSCAAGGALIVALGDKTTHLANIDRATWSFEGPHFARVVAVSLWRAGDTSGGFSTNATYQFWLSSPTEVGVIDECLASLQCHSEGEPQTPLSLANRVVVPASDLGSHVYINASCGGAPSSECKAGQADPNGYAAVVYLYAADVTLEQAAGPSASAVGGELAVAPAVAGTSDVAFSASDPGSGVYEALFALDGQLVQATPLDENGGRCRNVGQTADGAPAFLYMQPCLPSLSADVGLDTTRLANGVHHLVVSVLDAAGNAAPVLDRNITIANAGPATPGGGAVGGPGPPNGTPASAQASLTVAWSGSRSARLLTGFGRSETVVGRLSGPGGAPIAGALIDVLATPSATGARTVAMAGPRTGADGRFSLRIVPGASSRTLRFAYRVHLGDPLPVATRTLTLIVRAAVSLAVSPRLTSVGRRIYFRGRVLGGPVPVTGKLLVLEARSPGTPWIKFDVIRSDRAGRYRASYRFRFPGPANYQFRVLCETEADYPFAAGASAVVGVHER